MHSFTPEIDDDLVWSRDETMTAWKILEVRFSIPVEVLKLRYKYLIDIEIAKDKAKNAGETKCLKCRNIFMSEHKINIRFCNPCKSINAEFAENQKENYGFIR